MSNPVPPPQASDLDTIFDVEGGIEPFTVSALNAAGIGDVDPERSSEEQSTPRAEVQIHLGACTRRNPSSQSADPRAGLPCAWKFRMFMTVATDRANPDQADSHSTFRAKARRVGALFLTQLNPLLPYHRIEELNEAGTTPSMVNEEARTEDISRLVFDGIVCVRPTAWPADPAAA